MRIGRLSPDQEGLEAAVRESENPLTLNGVSQAPPQYSPDGKWWWTGGEWVAVPRAPTGPRQIVREYENQKQFIKDANLLAPHGYELFTQMVVPNKPRWNHGMVAIQKNPGSTIVVTYQLRG